MQFQVPQFIDVEDKIVGPFTFKQFIYVAGGAGLSFIWWRFLPTFLSLPLIIASVAVGAAFAFMKYNGRPLITTIEHGFYFLLRTKLYLWDNTRAATRTQQSAQPEKHSSTVSIPELSSSKLHDLAWSLDIKEKIGGASVVSEGKRHE